MRAFRERIVMPLVIASSYQQATLATVSQCLRSYDIDLEFSAFIAIAVILMTIPSISDSQPVLLPSSSGIDATF